ncbi:MAG: ParB/RepB/Spo0J family partition protein [Clostridia bacterium]|nr:ParB/RepB/Spo0J family partition protein [Clostridia bacterium]
MKLSEKIVSINDLYEFKDNPYKVKDNEEMQDLIDSIKKYGIIEPLIVRKRDKGGYEIISGHRRKYACEKAGIKQVPVLIRDMDKNLAVITVVDSNLQRQDILPSEKAFAFKMKLDAERHQGKTSGQDVQKWTRENITDNMSGRQVQRYVRLTELTPELLKLVDENKMAMSPAVEISYLKKQEQKDLLETIESEDCTPSYPQAIRMRELSKQNKLDMDTIFNIMTEQKPNQKEQIKFKVEKLKGYFPKGYSTKQMEDTIEKLLKQYMQRWKNRDLGR